MTNTEYQVFRQAGAEAAASSIDAHGERVELELAYDFIREIGLETEAFTLPLSPNAEQLAAFAEGYYAD